jgi:oligogalacturonide lyase
MMSSSITTNGPQIVAFGGCGYGMDRKIKRIRTEGQNADGKQRRKDDWVCHEVWSRDGQYIFYHGGYNKDGDPRGGLNFIARTTPAADTPIEIAFDPTFRRYGHFTLSSDISLMVSDGYAEFGPPTTGLRQGEWISQLKVDWEAHHLTWEAVCHNGSSWDSQDSHPHPIFSHNDEEILFTSDMEGKRAVYAARP